MGAIAGIIAFLSTTIPQLVKMGVEVAPLISGIRGAVTNLGTKVAPDDAEFAKLDAMVREFEDDFDAAVAARLAG